MHTFLTDYDFVVLPHRAEDREAARNVQYLMASLLVSIGIEADWVMPHNFDNMTLEDLGSKYAPYTRVDPNDSFQQLMRNTHVSFFRFVMDLRVIDSYRVNGEGADYERRLDELKTKLIFSAPDNLRDLCGESYGIDLRRTLEPHADYVYKIKDNPLRLLHYALYASRAKLNIRGSNFWRTIEELERQGLISAEEKEQAKADLGFFINIRHLIGASLEDAADSTKITEEVLATLCRILGEDRAALTAKIEAARQELVDLSRQIFERLGYQIRS